MVQSLRIASCQLNPTVGDIWGNEAKIAEGYARAKADGADIAIFPELMILGYPPEDLVLRPTVIEDCRKACERLAAATLDGPALLTTSPWQEHGNLYNAALWMEAGAIQHVRLKHHLPNYGVFDEARVFSRGAIASAHRISGLTKSVCRSVKTSGSRGSRIISRSRARRSCYRLMGRHGVAPHMPSGPRRWARGYSMRVCRSSMSIRLVGRMSSSLTGQAGRWQRMAPSCNRSKASLRIMTLPIGKSARVVGPAFRQSARDHLSGLEADWRACCPRTGVITSIKTGSSRSYSAYRAAWIALFARRLRQTRSDRTGFGV